MSKNGGNKLPTCQFLSDTLGACADARLRKFIEMIDMFNQGLTISEIARRTENSRVFATTAAVELMAVDASGLGGARRGRARLVWLRRCPRPPLATGGGLRHLPPARPGGGLPAWRLTAAAGWRLLRHRRRGGCCPPEAEGPRHPPRPVRRRPSAGRPSRGALSAGPLLGGWDRVRFWNQGAIANYRACIF